MKAYCVYQKTAFSSDDIHAMLVAEDGHVLADHLCSHPNYVYGDLWGRREERKKKHPSLQVDHNPISIEDFEQQYPDVFNRAFEKVSK